ncbi:asparagine--tRNA ligase [Sedimenticola selenatireducens]|uniref:Asparagine--tRNA ligase n=1 Tax=Sedimenticola selenatireducens TaxID=191960 RepID=A0A557SN04_9GAMM|nr:asparagine--tRNA ligase [Sedimenticola selenatireducens]TVO78692.1 asparagine--tRNA ligase [Sedimenticola selenatireducens]TVT62054.1 MAG: asparagine--tRNA ligase [Sedimenticola selenatireducens]
MDNHDIKFLLSDAIPLDSEVTVRGWVRSRRDSKAGFSFVAVYDGSCFDAIQTVIPNHLENYSSEVLKITTGCSVEVTGLLSASVGQGQAREVQVTAITVIGWVDDPDTYPIAKKRHTFEYLRQVAHLRPRTNAFGAISRIRTTLSSAIHRYFHEQNYHWVNTPIITASDCEGAGELFRVSTLDLSNLPRSKSGAVDFETDFFGREAFLTVSGQLNAEAYALALSKVYTFGPTFRAENSNTSRHLAEFWMVEPEVAFADLNDNARLAEDFLKYIFKAVMDERQDDMEFFAQRIDKQAIERLDAVISSDFEMMEYSDAIDILIKSGEAFVYPVKWGLDLQSEHEQYLAEKHVGRPVILVNYPASIKAFYMRLNDDEKSVAAMDVLVPGIGEIIGGSQREERLEVLDKRIQSLGIEGDLSWYRDLRRYGTVPHAGFGMGFERVVNYVTGMENIRDAIPFPRTPKHALF